MFQSRKEDLSEKITKIRKEATIYEVALQDVELILEKLEASKEKLAYRTSVYIVSIDQYGNKYVDLTISLSDPLKKSKINAAKDFRKLTEATHHAFTSLFESYRADLIHKYNNLLKDE